MNQFEEFINYRKYLHQHPEISGQELETSIYIKNIIKLKCPSAQLFPLSHNGIIAHFKGKKKGKHIMLRCELDALPIQEINRFDHQSKNHGVGHKCGHDGHMTILLAVARYLDANPIYKGSVSLLFQPSEENGKGAPQVISDPHFNKYGLPDYIYALHNVPGYDLHSIVYKPNHFTPSVISIKIYFEGITAHAAEPESGINPTFALPELIQSIQELEEPDTSSDFFRIFTPVYFNIGSESYGTSAGNGVIGYTIRTWSNELITKCKLQLEDIIKRIAKKNHLEYRIDWFEEFRSIENHSDCVNRILHAADICNYKSVEKDSPFKWGEDFGLYTEIIPGAMFGLGAGKSTPALHNPDYDFPDELIESGSKMFIEIINSYSNE